MYGTAATPFGRGALYHLLANPIYVGAIRHRSVTYPGQHEAIVERATWRRVQDMQSHKGAHPARTNHQEKHRPAYG